MEFVGRDYVIVSKRLAHKREIVACAEALKMSRREVVALVLEFWAWCDDNTSDGLLKGICSQAALDGLVGTIGFTEAMVQVGWLRLTNEGYALPNWGRWNGDTAKSRLLNRERVRRHRDKGGGGTCNANVMPSALPGGTIGGASSSGDSLSSKREDPKSKKAFVFESPFDSERFMEKWNEWLAFRTSKRYGSYAPETLAKLANQFRAWGEQASIDAIDRSILNSWRGLFEPRDGAGGRAGSPRVGPGQKYSDADGAATGGL